VFVASIFCIIQASRLNIKFGVPDVITYCFGSQVVEFIEITLFMLQTRIIIARMIPPGVEATMMAFFNTLIALDLFNERTLVGVFLNKTFVGAT
jgi:hypothetical protein